MIVEVVDNEIEVASAHRICLQDALHGEVLVVRHDVCDGGVGEWVSVDAGLNGFLVDILLVMAVIRTLPDHIIDDLVLDLLVLELFVDGVVLALFHDHV
jgi:hypothetical protein